MIQWNISVAIPVNLSSCLLYMWHSDNTVVSLHQHYNTYSVWFLDVRICQLVQEVIITRLFFQAGFFGCHSFPGHSLLLSIVLNEHIYYQEFIIHIQGGVSYSVMVCTNMYCKVLPCFLAYHRKPTGQVRCW